MVKQIELTQTSSDEFDYKTFFQTKEYTHHQKTNFPEKQPSEYKGWPIDPQHITITKKRNIGFNGWWMKEIERTCRTFKWGKIPSWAYRYLKKSKTSRFDDPRYAKWRINVLKKSDFKCQNCSSIYRLHAHHIENYAQHKNKRYDVENGIILCKKCHMDFHDIYGRKNNNKIQLKMFMEGTP